ncbi:histamine H2 receptor-like [Strongylocentrotus purpuratus]|uniref:G-protein coupled receptors family 1 profile domain-containing protein n=1 Tax=Strongylocentrotus purpuratus TaxID=7668 RepID=A0A7M7HMR8_STRPU|nr:histamine H2 receptor-like [Strongylocentrotus purpuratus]|eukprot:XP_011681664.1 PREDICTED: histamine H2 receptor-like [Strongylocentrotus purpuratus]
MALVNTTVIMFRANHPAYTGVCIVFALLLMCVSVVGNFLVIATFLKTDRLRKPTYYLLSSLAFVDFLNGAVGIPVEIFKRFVLIEFTCLYTSSRYLSALTYLFGGNSMIHLVMVTWDRYIAVHKPLRYETLVTSKQIALGIFFSWSISISLVIGLVAKKEDPTLIGNYCAGTNYTQTDRLTRIGILLVMTAVFLSGITLITLNVIILRTAMRHARRIAQMQQAVGAGHDDTTSRVKASQIVTIITLGFLICYIPTSIFHIILGIDIEGRLFSRPFDDVTIFIFYCSSALNPIIYCYRDRVFRENALRYFKDKAVWRNLCSAESTFV